MTMRKIGFVIKRINPDSIHIISHVQKNHSLEPGSPRRVLIEGAEVLTFTWNKVSDP